MIPQEFGVIPGTGTTAEYKRSVPQLARLILFPWLTTAWLDLSRKSSDAGRQPVSGLVQCGLREEEG